MAGVLESLLDPIPRNDFREQYYGRQPLLIRGHAQKFAGLFTWPALNDLLNSSAFPHPHIEISSAGKRDRHATRESIIEQCRAGASLVFRQLQLFDPRVGELTRALEAETGEPMFATLVVSQPSHATVERHWDRYDGFVFHLEGRKAWTVYEEPAEKPIVFFAKNREAPASRPRLEGELQPGDLLYVPRGYWHEALAQRGLSVHLTVGVMARTGIDFLAWLVDELRGDARFRHEFPLAFADEPEELRETRLREHVAKLAAMLDARLRDPATLAAFIEHCRVPKSGVRRFDFPAQLLETPPDPER
jgi:ribosomal protein L16 Arg81 hydroxylase